MEREEKKNLNMVKHWRKPWPRAHGPWTNLFKPYEENINTNIKNQEVW